MRLESVAIDIEGVIRVGGIPMGDGFHLRFSPQAIAFLGWTAEIDTNGSYAAHIRDNASNEICGWLSRTQPLNHVMKCGQFYPGLQRFDFDVAPGIIRVEVPPVPGAADVWSEIVVGRDRSRNGPSASFKLAPGFSGEFFAGGYGTYRITVQSGNFEKVLASSSVALTSDEPLANVNLPVTADQTKSP
jgi:hypothetical protein